MSFPPPSLSLLLLLCYRASGQFAVVVGQNSQLTTQIESNQITKWAKIKKQRETANSRGRNSLACLRSIKRRPSGTFSLKFIRLLAWVSRASARRRMKHCDRQITLSRGRRMRALPVNQNSRAPCRRAHCSLVRFLTSLLFSSRTELDWPVVWEYFACFLTSEGGLQKLQSTSKSGSSNNNNITTHTNLI